MKKGILYVSAILVLLCATSIYILSAEKAAYVDIPELLEGFELKKELTAKLSSSIQMRKNITDSLYASLHSVKAQMSVDQDNKQLISEYKRIETQLAIKSEQFEHQNQLQASEYDEQILNQMNQYVREFGEQNGYDIIYGANGSGNILYAKEHKNITVEVLQFINNSYQGLK